MESEWTFACEGEAMQPYPYGWTRAAGQCNADHVDLLAPGHPSRLKDERDPVGAHPSCKSPFGVLDMAGNVAEWVSVDGRPEGSAVVQKGNWWQPGKHACRDAQAGHDRFYKGAETGVRCCSSPSQ
jgi:formylglycine-generating enzyme required for sulfatase activity